MDILDFVTTAANGGDHLCRTLDASVEVRSNINNLNGDKDGDGDVTQEELDAYTLEEADEYLDVVAVGLLGHEKVAEVKVEAIAKLMEDCKKNLKARGLSQDAVDLFSEACDNLDADGDGQIDEEEFKAVKKAKLGMDHLVRATTILEASNAITDVALALMGPHAVALLKIKAVARAMPRIWEVASQCDVDEDAEFLLDAVQTRADYQASLSYAQAAEALDADGDGDVDDEEFDAAARAYNIMERMVEMMEKVDLLARPTSPAADDVPGVKVSNPKLDKRREEYTEKVDQLAINICGPAAVHKIKNNLVKKIIDSILLTPKELDRLAHPSRPPTPEPEPVKASWFRAAVMLEANPVKEDPSLLNVCGVGKAVPTLLQLAREEIDEPGLPLETMREAVLLSKKAKVNVLIAHDIMVEYDDGDGEIDDEEMEELKEKGITMAPPEQASDSVDIIATILIGDERVAQFKVDAIAAALEECKIALGKLIKIAPKGSALGVDSVELFENAVNGLDEDGDGHIDAEEMVAVRNAMNCVDKIAAAEDPEIAAAAVDKMAKVVLGAEALSDFKAKGVIKLLPSVKEMITDYNLDQDMHSLLQHISDCLAETPAWPLEIITASKIHTDILVASESAEVAVAALDTLGIFILGIVEVARIKNHQISMALAQSVERFESLHLIASLRVMAEVEAVCLRDCITEIPIPQLTRTKGLLDELNRDDADVDWFIFAVISLAFECFGDDHSHSCKLEVFEPSFEECKANMDRNECSETQLRLFANVKAAGLRDTPLLEREWVLVMNLMAAEGNDDVVTAFEALTCCHIGDETARRGPSQITIPKGRSQKQKERATLSGVTTNNLKKIRSAVAFGQKTI